MKWFEMHKIYPTNLFKSGILKEIWNFLFLFGCIIYSISNLIARKKQTIQQVKGVCRQDTLQKNPCNS